MVTSFRWKLVAGVLVGSLLTVQSVWAQQQRDPQRPGQREGQKVEKRQLQREQQQQPDRERTALRPVQATGEQTDQMIATLLAIGNQGEVKLGQFAAKHAQSEEVRQFAQMMAQDHAKFVKQLSQIAPEAVAQVTAQGQNQDRPALDEEGAAEGKRTEAGFDFVNVHKEFSNKFINSVQQNLAKRDPQKFDEAFIGYEIVLHEQLLDMQQVLKDHASPKLQTVIDQGIESTQAHLKHARQLLDQLTTTADEQPATERRGAIERRQPEGGREPAPRGERGNQ